MNYKKNVLLFSFSLGCSVVAQVKPNVLWLTIEDTSPQFIGCYGNKDAKTPVIDKLASDGVRFSNAFSCGTVSSPSRSCIITGVKTYKMGTGNHRSNYPIPDYIKGFPYYLQQEGYYTSNNYKTDYNVANAVKFTKEAWNESSNKAGWWNRKPGQPFFAVFNFMDSHQSRTMTFPYDWYEENILNKLPLSDRTGDNEFVMPPFYNDSPAMRKQFARVYNAITLTDSQIGDVIKRLEKDNLKDSTIIFFYADHGEGEPRAKTNGINLGYRVPFVIWFPEMYKHLSPWGKAGIVSDELIDFEDLAPTLISMVGGAIPNYLKGRVLIGDKRSKTTDHLVLSNDRADNGIDLVRSVTNGKYMYSRNFMPFMPEVRFIRYVEAGEIKQLMRKDLAENKLNTLQRSIFNDRPAEFLFDIENDTWESNNLAANFEYKALIKKMRAQLKEEILQSCDVMLLPEYEMALISKSTTAYEFRLNEANYPITKVYDAAILSGYRGKDIVKKQIKLLKSPNKIVRYWAAIGLRSQSAIDLKCYSKVIKKAVNDPYPPVAVTASAIAFDIYSDKTAQERLKEFCAAENQDIALLSINFLLYINNKESFIDTIKAVNENKKNTYNVLAACKDFLVSQGLLSPYEKAENY